MRDQIELRRARCTTSPCVTAPFYVTRLLKMGLAMALGSAQFAKITAGLLAAMPAALAVSFMR